MVSEVSAVPLLLLVGLLSFRVALWRIKVKNIDYGQVLDIPDFQQYPTLLQLHTHRLAIYTLVCVLVDLFMDSRVVTVLLVIILPGLYLINARDIVTAGIRRNLKQAFLMTRKDVDLNIVIFSDGLSSYARLLPIMGRVLLQDIVKSPGYVDITSALLVALPFWVRMRQCLQEYYYNKHGHQRSLLNALRYATNFPVIFLALSNPNHSCAWIITTIVNQSSNAVWDHFVDWSPSASKWSFTEKSMAVSSLAVRVLWTMRAVYPIPFSHHIIHYALIGVEVCRRMAWLVLRLQHAALAYNHPYYDL